MTGLYILTAFICGAVTVLAAQYFVLAISAGDTPKLPRLPKLPKLSNLGVFADKKKQDKDDTPKPRMTMPTPIDSLMAESERLDNEEAAKGGVG